MEAGNQKEIAVILKQYKLPEGIIDFKKVFDIPLEDRLPAMYKKDFMRTNMLVLGAVTMALEKLNLKKKDFGRVINDIAEDVLINYDSDRLSMEDLMLFLQQLSRGEYGDIADISLPKFTGLFEKYLDKRYEEGVRLRDERDAYYKHFDNSIHFKRNDEKITSPFGQQLEHFKQKLQTKSDEREEQKRYDK